MKKALIGITTLAALTLGSTAAAFAASAPSSQSAGVAAHQQPASRQVFSLSELGNPHPAYSSEQASRATLVGTLENPQTVLNLMVPLSALGDPKPTSPTKAPASFTSDAGTKGVFCQEEFPGLIITFSLV